MKSADESTAGPSCRILLREKVLSWLKEGVKNASTLGNSTCMFSHQFTSRKLFFMDTFVWEMVGSAKTLDLFNACLSSLFSLVLICSNSIG